MYVYLDESGDTGFRFNRGSTRFFVVTLILVDDPGPIEQTIERLRKREGLVPHREFHFVHCSDHLRTAFLQAVRDQDFRVRALVIDKTKMNAPHMRNRDTFYNYVVQLALRHDFGSIENAVLVLEESVKSRKKKREAATCLRQQLNERSRVPKFKRTVYRSSHADDMLQVADMVSGAINRRFSRDDNRFYRLIERRVEDCWVWNPRKTY